MAFVGANGCFMGVDEEGDIVCKSKKAGPAEYIQVIISWQKVWSFCLCKVNKLLLF